MSDSQSGQKCFSSCENTTIVLGKTTLRRLQTLRGLSLRFDDFKLSNKCAAIEEVLDSSMNILYAEDTYID